MAQRKNSKSHSKKEGKTAPPEQKNGKRSDGGAAGGGAKFSVFTWVVVLALLGVWSSMAVVYFDIVDYDNVIARAQEFRWNFSEVLQGKLAAYDTDNDGDFDVEDAKVLLGETSEGSEKNTTKAQTSSHPHRGVKLRAALRNELRLIHEKMEAKRIARIALAEIRALLAEEDEKREVAWAQKMKDLEVARLKMEAELVEKERLEKEKAVEQEKLEKERLEREQKERQERERAEKERLEREKEEKEEKERLERQEKERLERERQEKERLERERQEK
ncbi:PREDICTED: stress response protein NST1-like, partial [Cyprinodon variegatus]